MINIASIMLQEYLKGKTKSEQVKRLKKLIEKSIEELKDVSGSKKFPKYMVLKHLYTNGGEKMQLVVIRQTTLEQI